MKRMKPKVISSLRCKPCSTRLKKNICTSQTPQQKTSENMLRALNQEGFLKSELQWHQSFNLSFHLYINTITIIAYMSF